MAQFTPHTNGVPTQLTKPITLTIMPQPKTPTQSSGPLTTQAVTIQNNQTSIENIPNFNHIPIVPIIVPKSTISLEEKEARRLAKQRERNNRYRDKTKPYIDLANVPTEKEKIIGVVKLCYPQLAYLPPAVLDREISLFIQHITRQRS
ncbi:Hypothetical protein HVR_LOCUS994 [uncultured virus]|nr:Hypothetical protein HVR_LOCUS994 [uncultured virus]